MRVCACSTTVLGSQITVEGARVHVLFLFRFLFSSPTISFLMPLFVPFSFMPYFMPFFTPCWLSFFFPPRLFSLQVLEAVAQIYENGDGACALKTLRCDNTPLVSTYVYIHIHTDVLIHTDVYVYTDRLCDLTTLLWYLYMCTLQTCIDSHTYVCVCTGTYV